MKKIIYIGFMATTLMCSCDVLVEKPQAIAVETFYNTAEEIEAGVNGVYVPIRSSFRAGYPIIIEESSDLFVGGLGSYLIAGQYKGLDNTNISRISDVWANFYRAIRNANILIEAIPKADAVSDEDKSKFMGETKYLRALTYFQLVRSWGAIPLRTEANMADYNIPRSSEQDIYNLIINDLTMAEASLPVTVPVSGHPTKWSAKMLLADVYSSLGQYDKAAALTNEIIQSGQYSLVEVQKWEDFDNLYGAKVVTTPEEIFYFKYHEEDGFSLALFFHGSGNAGEYIRVPGYNVIYNRIDHSTYIEQDDKDLRKGFWYPYAGGLVLEGGLLLRKYNDPDGLNPRNSFPLYRYADCLLLYAEASCRVAGTPTADGLEALNKVRRRAYGYPSTQPSPVDYKLDDYDRDSFIELCVEERGYETIGEAKRWLDLKRLGKAIANKYVKANRGMDIADKHWLWPIPVSELNFNEAITDQNPGY